MVPRDWGLYECVFDISTSYSVAARVLLALNILPSVPVDGGAEHTENRGKDRRACANVVRSVEGAVRGQAYDFSLVSLLKIEEEAGYEDGREARTQHVWIRTETGRLTAPRTTHYSRNVDVMVAMLNAVMLVSLVNNLAHRPNNQICRHAFELNGVGSLEPTE